MLIKIVFVSIISVFLNSKNLEYRGRPRSRSIWCQVWGNYIRVLGEEIRTVKTTNMSLEGVRLLELKVVDLKRELEERDAETAGTKSVLQLRLRKLMEEAGEDPETFIFESAMSVNELNEAMEKQSNELKEMRTLQVSMEEKMERKLQDHSRDLKEEMKTLQDHSRDFKEEMVKLQEQSSRAIEEKMEKLQDQTRAVEEKMEIKLQEYSRNMDEKIEKSFQECSNVEKKFQEYSVAVDEKINEFTKQMKVLENQVHPSTVRMDFEQDKTSDTDRKSMGSDAAPTVESTRNDMPTFDGKSSWEEYLTLFETMAMINGWSLTRKASVLSVSLRGDALRVLQTIPLYERQNFKALVERLEMRFGHRHMEQLYRSQLKNRIQRSNETLQEFEADIARLVRSAYPTVSDDVCESLAVEKFLDGLRASETQQAVKLARPQTLSEALTQALEFEAVKQSLRGHAQARVMEVVEENRQLSIEDIVKKVLEALKGRKRQLRCWGCGQVGHLRNRCPGKSEQQSQEN